MRGGTRRGTAVLGAWAVALSTAAGLVAFPRPAHAAPGAFAVPGPVLAPGGAFLRDSLGRALGFHGVNLVAKCAARTAGNPCIPTATAPADQPAYYLDATASDPGRRFTDRDAATLERLGVTLVRLGVIWEALEPGPPGAGPDDPRWCTPHRDGTPYDTRNDPFSLQALDAYLAHVDAEVALLRAHGMRVVIDMHQDVWGATFSNPAGPTPWKGEGAPAWATCTNGLPFTPTPTWQGAYATSAPVSTAFDHLYANDVSGDLMGNLIRVWRAVAAHFRGDPAVLGYDLFNEPFDPSTVTTPEFDRKLQCMYAGQAHAPLSCAATVPHSQAPADGLIPAIRSADPDHLILYEAPVVTDFGAPETVGVTEPLPFPGLVLDFHDYGFPLGGMECTDPHCGPEEQLTMAQFEQARASTRTAQPGGPAWLLSEWGAEDDTADLTRVAALADSAIVPWTYWAAKQLNDPTGGPREALLDDAGAPRPKTPIIVRPYALATAGTPTLESFDVTAHAYQLRFAADPAIAAPTLIRIPVDVHYPAGYAVQVSGASVLSACDAPLLVLGTSPGAARVEVHVTPGPCTAATSSPAASVALPNTAAGRTGAAGAVSVAIAGLAVLARRRRTRGR